MASKTSVSGLRVVGSVVRLHVWRPDENRCCVFDNVNVLIVASAPRQPGPAPAPGSLNPGKAWLCGISYRLDFISRRFSLFDHLRRPGSLSQSGELRETPAADRLCERRRLSPLKWTRAQQRPTVPHSTSQQRAWVFDLYSIATRAYGPTAVPSGSKRHVSEVWRSDLGDERDCRQPKVLCARPSVLCSPLLEFASPQLKFELTGRHSSVMQGAPPIASYSAPCYGFVARLAGLS